MTAAEETGCGSGRYPKMEFRRMEQTSFESENTGLLKGEMPHSVQENAQDFFLHTWKCLSAPFERLHHKRLALLEEQSISLHENAHCRTASVVRLLLLQKWDWEIPDHLPCSPNMSSCNFDLFRKLKRALERPKIPNERHYFSSNRALYLWKRLC